MPDLKMGDRVRLIDNQGLDKDFPLGSLGVLESDPYVGDRGGVFVRVKYDHLPYNCTHKAKRFELVEAAPVRPFKVGDKVKVVKKVTVDPLGGEFYWAVSMDDLVNDGEIYTIEEFGEQGNALKLNCGWWFLKESLIHADAIPVEKEEPPVLKKDNLKKGDKVFVIRKVFDHNGERVNWNMEMVAQFKDQKKEYTVKCLAAVGDSVLLDNGWWYLAGCLAFVNPPKDKPPKKKIKPKKPAVPPIRRLLKEEAQKQGHRSICSYALEFEDGKHRLQVNDVCHYRVRVGRDEGKIKNLALSLHHAKQQLGNDRLAQYRKYTDYLLNRSPWADCFLTKSVSAAFNAGILMNVNKPLSQVAGACVALREGIEFCDKLPVFMLLKEKGYSEHTAYILSYAITRRHDKTFQIGEMHGGHQAMAGDRNWLEVLSFFKNGFKDRGELPYKEKATSYEIHNAVAAFERIKAASFDGFIRKNVVWQERGAGWLKVVYISDEALCELANKVEQLIKEQA